MEKNRTRNRNPVAMMLLLLAALGICMGIILSSIQAEASETVYFSGNNSSKAACILSGDAATYYDTVMSAFAAISSDTGNMTCYIRGGDTAITYQEAFNQTVKVENGRKITIAAYGGDAVLQADAVETEKLFYLNNGEVTLGGTGSGTLTIDFNHQKGNNAFYVKSVSKLTLKTGVVLQNAQITDEPHYVFSNDIASFIYVWYNGNSTSNQALSIEGGEITGCTVGEYAHLIYIRKGACFNMSAGSITGNTLGRTSSAVYARDGQYAKIQISGGMIQNDTGYALKDTVGEATGIVLSGSPKIDRIWHYGVQPIEASDYTGGAVTITPANVALGEGVSTLYVKGVTDKSKFILSDPGFQLTEGSEGLYLSKSSLSNAELVQNYVNAENKPQVAEVKTVVDQETGLTFVHPGILKNKAILDQARDHIRQGDEPWSSSFLTLVEQVNLIPRVSEHARATQGFDIGTDTTDNKPTLLQPLEDDAEEALQQTELWYVTGQQEYLDNALQIIRGWSHLQSVGNVYDEQIQASRGVYYLCQAAEILRYSAADSGWTQQDTENFIHLLTVLEGKYNRITHLMNQDGECIRATMAAAIFQNDLATYKKCIERMTINPELHDQCVAGEYTQADQECDPNQPCLHSRSGAILFQFREVTKDASTGAAVEPNIQLVEMGRDQTHPGADIYNPVHVGMTAYIQGTMIDPETGLVTNNIMTGKSIFEYLDNRVLKGTEYYCRYNSEDATVANELTYYPTYKDASGGYYSGFNSEDSEKKSGKAIGWRNYIVGLLYHYYDSVYPLLNGTDNNPINTTDGEYVKKAYEYACEQGETDLFFYIPTTEDLILMKAPDVKGDYDGDGQVTVSDVQLFQSQGYNLDNPTNTQKMLFDYNEDGKVNENDAMSMLSKIYNLNVKGAQVRKDGGDGFRFVSQFSAEKTNLSLTHSDGVTNGIYQNTEGQTVQYGTILIPKAIVDYAAEKNGKTAEDYMTISVDTNRNITSQGIDTVDRGTYQLAVVPSKVVFSTDEAANLISYTAVLTGMDNYKKIPFYARAYCVIGDEVVYSDIITRTWQDVYDTGTEADKVGPEKEIRDVTLNLSGDAWKAVSASYMIELGL